MNTFTYHHDAKINANIESLFTTLHVLDDIQTDALLDGDTKLAERMSLKIARIEDRIAEAINS